jgi:hypothetical protein
MPSDGSLSISVVNPTLPSYSVGVNSPTNFAGETGQVELPQGLPVLSPAGGAVAVLCVGAVAWLGLRARRFAAAR